MRRATIAVGIAVLGGLLCAPRQQPPRTSAAVKAAADSTRRLRVLVSLVERRIWVLGAGGDTLRTAPVAVGSNRTLRSGTRQWTFTTPVSIRAVTSVETEPVWIRPDWAYVELAKQRKLKLDSVTASRPRSIAGGGQLVVRGTTVGIARDSIFEPWPANEEIVVDGTLFIPPLGTPYRAVPAVLGHFRLRLGGTLGFHGTLEKASIGKAVTHGCMRLHDDDVEWLYRNVPVGTPVFIY